MIAGLAAYILSLPHAAARPSPQSPQSRKTTQILAHGPRVAELSSERDTSQQSGRLLYIDWASLRFDDDADAIKVWRQIAPTGADWERKLEEVPGDLRIARALAVAMIRSGGFACAPVAVKTCKGTATGIPPPTRNSTLADACLRRRLAVWSFDRLEADDIPKLRAALRSIAKLPPPESELVELALRALPESDSAGRYELIQLAWKAGHRDLLNGMLSGLPDRYLVDAVQRLHIDGALDMLSPETHRSVFMRAIRDEKLKSAARVFAVDQLAESSSDLAPDLRSLLISATKHRDCSLAAAAARALESYGDRSFVPLPPTTTRKDVMMRFLCVLANYQAMQSASDPSLLSMYVPSRGLEIARVATNRDSGPSTRGADSRAERSIELIPRSFAKLPDIAELRQAFDSCTGGTCTTADRTFRFMFRTQNRALALWRIEVIDRLPCSG